MNGGDIVKFFSLLRVEIGRLLCRRLTWWFLLLTVASPFMGLFFYCPIKGSVTGTYLGNPVLAGALIGAVLFALLTALELDRIYRTHTNLLIEAMTTPMIASLCKTLSILFVVGLAQAIMLAVWLPFSIVKIGAVFRLWRYFSVYLSVLLPAMIFAVFFTACVYQIVQRLDLTIILDGAFVVFSMTIWSEDWLLRWVNPAISYLSDDFSIARTLQSVLYNRLFWLLLLSGFWCFSFLCVRRYGKNVIGSFRRNFRRLALPIFAIIFFAVGKVVYAEQPFVDHSKAELDNPDFYNINYNDFVTYSKIHVDAKPNFLTGSHFGICTIPLRNESGMTQTISFWLNPGYQVSKVTVNKIDVPFRSLDNDEQNQNTIEIDLPADKELELVMEYGGFPKEWNILSTMQGSAIQISQEGMVLANQDFSPIPRDIVDGTDTLSPFTATIALPAKMNLVAFGNATTTRIDKNADGTVNWKVEDVGGSTIIYAGDYVSQSMKAAGIQIEFLYSEKHQRIMEEYNVKQVLTDVFDYCTTHYGALSFYEDGKLKLIETGNGGGYAGNGASVMGEDSFSEEGFRDPMKGTGGREVLAHEIVHQWWGLGNMFDSSDLSDPWSSEGLTVYTTYRMMKERHGAAYAQQNYIDKWQEQVDGYYQNFYVQHPEFLDDLPEKYQIDMKNSITNMRQYCEMPLKIWKAEQLVGGEAKMDEILRELFTREIDYSYPYLTFQNFLDACGLTEEDLNLD